MSLDVSRLFGLKQKLAQFDSQFESILPTLRLLLAGLAFFKKP